MFADRDKNQEISPDIKYPRDFAKIFSVAENFPPQGTEAEIIHKVRSEENPGSSYEIRTILTSDLVEGQEEPKSITQSMVIVDENGVETLLINIDNDTSDIEYGVFLFIDFDAIESLDISDIDEKDFEGYAVMIAALRAAKADRKAFEAQEPFWKRKFISDIFKN